jgi:hypothetical protein
MLEKEIKALSPQEFKDILTKLEHDRDILYRIEGDSTRVYRLTCRIQSLKNQLGTFGR